MQMMTDHGPKCSVSVEQLNKAQSNILLLQVCTCMYILCMYVCIEADFLTLYLLLVLCAVVVLKIALVRLFVVKDRSSTD